MAPPGLPALAHLPAVVACGAAALAATRHRRFPSGRALAGIAIAGAVWAAGRLGAALVADSALARAFDLLGAAGALALPPLAVGFAAAIAGPPPPRRWPLLAALLVEPTVAFAVVVDLSIVAEPVRELVANPFLAHVAATYALLAVAAVPLVRGALGPWRRDRRVAGVLLAGFAASWLANALFLFGPLAVDPTPSALAVTGVAVLAVAYDSRFPSAVAGLRSVAGRIDQPVLVLDSGDRLVDANAAARDLFGLDDGAAGRSAASLLARVPALAGRSRERDGDVVAVDARDGRRYFLCSVSSVGGAVEGRRVLLCELGDGERRSRPRRGYDPSLDRFARALVDDLRDSLTVAAGRLALAADTGDLGHVERAAGAVERADRRLVDALASDHEGSSDPLSLAALAHDAWAGAPTADASLTIEGDRHVGGDRARLLALFEVLFADAVRRGASAVTVGTLADGVFVATDVPVGEGVPGFVERVANDHGWIVATATREDGGTRVELRGADFTDPDG